MLDDWGLRDETVLPPAYPVDEPPPPKQHGSIYQSNYAISLYQDHIARRIGDILTVKLEESTQGEKAAHTKTNKISSIDTNNGSTSNNPSTNGGGSLRPVFFGQPAQALIFNMGSDMEFDGKGQTNQSNRLRGTISVTVVRVLSNNNLIIQGESWVVINQGREYIRLTGIVRPEDIDANNTVSSQRIANARISYSGTGQVGNASRGGLITQLFTKFFPF
ncbi:Flagellar L-ring protein (plasmid) [Aquicella lusitana]|uniref:Flagellar L-ring protein n=2 Tax=Aquicella lusitana TaxID=254246 RepID=A0A370G851_9COXI|nr:flagellar L-ring protein precursor FlgH [Aquicella lusitana]VVC74564.1 Flagellar L-ring protein [Aquicella lusitana]